MKSLLVKVAPLVLLSLVNAAIIPSSERATISLSKCCAVHWNQFEFIEFIWITTKFCVGINDDVTEMVTRNRLLKTGPYSIEPNSLTVSGISAGGAFATQFHVAFSSQVVGVGIYAGCKSFRIGKHYINTASDVDKCGRVCAIAIVIVIKSGRVTLNCVVRDWYYFVILELL